MGSKHRLQLEKDYKYSKNIQKANIKIGIQIWFLFA